jgi:molybdenum cofactor cytidylyltransferase
VSLPGVILAAGRSTRMGRDKALLPLAGSTFLNTLVATFLSRLDPVIVVLGHHAERVAATLVPDPRLLVARNPDYDRGMLSSLQSGLHALPPDSSGAIFTLVDHPRLQPQTLAAVRDALERDNPLVVIPRYQGERGHPVALARQTIDELLALSPSDSPKTVIRSHRDRTLFLDLDDPAVTEDIDRPEQYQAAFD